MIRSFSTSHRGPVGRLLARNVLIVVGTLGALAVLAGPAGAESPNELQDELNNDGVYVARSRTDVDEVSLEAAVADVRAESVRVVVVAPADPQPSSEAFARRIQEKVSADVAIVFPPPNSEDNTEEVDGNQLEVYVTDDLSGRLVRSRAAARAEPDPAQAVRVLVHGLTNDDPTESPPIFGRLVIISILLVLILGGVVAYEQMSGSRPEGQQNDLRENHVSNR